MFEQIPAPDHVVAFRLSGKLVPDDIERYKALFDAKLAKHKRVGVCVDMTGFSDMSAGAIAADVKAEFGLLAHLNQIARCAMISDKEWPQALVQFGAPLLPTLGLKVFAPAQRGEAMQWAAELPAAVAPPPHAVRFLATSRDDVLAFEVDGVISAAEMPGVMATFEARLKGHDKVRLLNRMTHFGGFDPAILMQGGLVAMKLDALQKVERYAIVGAPGWMGWMIERMNPAFAAIDMRTFPADREAEAWAWIGAEPAK